MSHTRRRHPALRVAAEVRIAAAVARAREAAFKLTHVRVGDHSPERRAPRVVYHHDLPVKAGREPQFQQFKL